MIEKVFNNITKEAREGKILLNEVVYNENIVYPLYISFNIVSNEIRNDIPNFYIKNKNKFFDLLKNYVYTVSEIYNIEITEDSAKEIISRLFVNITNSEMKCLEDFVLKNISFLNESKINNTEYFKFVNMDVGSITSSIELQSINQETPYCFKSKFIKDSYEYNLPRISFGIKDNICYIMPYRIKIKIL